MVAPESPVGGQVTRSRQVYQRKMLNRLRRRCREAGVEPLGGRRWGRRRRWVWSAASFTVDTVALASSW